MGVAHPTEVRWEPEPAPSHVDALTHGPATVSAVAAHRVALEAAVRHAVDLAALRAVTHELTVTRRRLRAVTDRWIPRLEEALVRVQLGLEENERAEGVGLRRALAAGRSTGGES
jgi:V/A-type H+-transporting ATPase subunit D